MNECEGLYFVMGKTAIMQGFLQSDLDCAGFHLLNCPDLVGLVPIENFDPIVNQWLNGYNNATGLFSASQPSVGNLSDWPDPTGKVGQFLTVVGGTPPAPLYGWASLSQQGLVPAGGTTGQVLEKRSNSDFDLLWQTPSGGSGGGGTPAAVRAFSGVTVSVPNLVNTPIPFTGTRFDLNGQWNASNPTRLTANIAGTYSLFASVDWGNQAVGSAPTPLQSGTRVLTLRVNGGLDIAVDSNNADVTIGGDTYQCVSTLYYFNAGDYVEILAAQSSGATILINAGGNFSPEFAMVMEGGIAGPQGAAGQGVPVGGTTGQVLAKIDGTDYHTNWVTPAGGAGGGVTQVNTAAPLTGGPITSSGTIGMAPAPLNCFLGFTGPAQSGVASFQPLPVPANFQGPALSPAATASTSGVMMGMGTSVQFKPIKSGVVMVMMCGIGQNSLAGAFFQTLPAYGTGVPPSNGAALRGTFFSGGTVGTVPLANANVPFALMWIVKLTVGTNYWFDMGLRGGSGTARLVDTSFTLIEL